MDLNQPARSSGYFSLIGCLGTESRFEPRINTAGRLYTRRQAMNLNTMPPIGHLGNAASGEGPLCGHTKDYLTILYPDAVVVEYCDQNLGTKKWAAEQWADGVNGSDL